MPKVLRTIATNQFLQDRIVGIGLVVNLITLAGRREQAGGVQFLQFADHASPANLSPSPNFIGVKASLGMAV